MSKPSKAAMDAAKAIFRVELAVKSKDTIHKEYATIIDSAADAKYAPLVEALESIMQMDSITPVSIPPHEQYERGYATAMKRAALIAEKALNAIEGE